MVKYISTVLGAVIVIVFFSTQIGTVANFTTGITIAHTGFTPNPNITNTAGLVPLIQLVPFIYVALGLLVAIAIIEHVSGSGGFLFVKLTVRTPLSSLQKLQLARAFNRMVRASQSFTRLSYFRVV